MRMARHPIGTLTMKQTRQPKASVRNPPSDGPAMLAMPNEDDTMICQRMRRRRSGKMSATEAKVVPINMPAPTPCRARITTRVSIEPARAQPSEPAMKITMAPSTKTLRPNRSPMRPVIGRAMAVVSR